MFLFVKKLRTVMTLSGRYDIRKYTANADVFVREKVAYCYDVVRGL